MGILASFHHLHSLPSTSPIGVPMDLVLVPVWTRAQRFPSEGQKVSYLLLDAITGSLGLGYLPLQV